MSHKYDPDCPFCEEKPLTPKMLVKKMVKVPFEDYECPDYKEILRVVLQAIADGEVVTIRERTVNFGECDEETISEAVLNPSFSKFLKGA